VASEIACAAFLASLQAPLPLDPRTQATLSTQSMQLELQFENWLNGIRYFMHNFSRLQVYQRHFHFSQGCIYESLAWLVNSSTSQAYLCF
jgi:hypothetical protein